MDQGAPGNRARRLQLRLTRQHSRATIGCESTTVRNQVRNFNTGVFGVPNPLRNRVAPGGLALSTRLTQSFPGLPHFTNSHPFSETATPTSPRPLLVPP